MKPRNLTRRQRKKRLRRGERYRRYHVSEKPLDLESTGKKVKFLTAYESFVKKFGKK